MIENLKNKMIDRKFHHLDLWNKKSFILAGSIVGLHGLKGYIKVKSFLENPKDIFKFGEYFIDKISFSSILLKFNKKSVFICELEGINSIEEAKKFVNKVLTINIGSPIDTRKYSLDDRKELAIIVNSEVKKLKNELN